MGTKYKITILIFFKIIYYINRFNNLNSYYRKVKK